MLWALLIAHLFVGHNAPRSEDRRYLALHNEELFGGDMILPPIRMLRNGIVDEECRWPTHAGMAIVPYFIDTSLEEYKSLIVSAMEDYHSTTCVRFVPRTNEDTYVIIFKGEGCYSTVGRSALSQPQPLSLGEGCLNRGTILHELGHTLGFYHEQNRPDRDRYLLVYQDNVKPGLRHNFRKVSPHENICSNVCSKTPFDFESIMIYGNYAFSRNPNSDATMEARNGRPLRNPYEKNALSPADVQRVRLLYKCD